MPQISVIVPVYNTEQYIEKCVRSILGQTFFDLELILVDDGSKDSSPEICDRFGIQDNRVKVIHKENAGVSAARNTGLEAASGEFITFVDSDDYIEKEMYQSMMEMARKYDCDLVMCDCLKEFENHAELYSHEIRQGYYNRQQLEKEYFPHLLIMPNVEYPPTISNCLCLYKYRHRQSESNWLRYAEGIRYSEDLLFGAQMAYHAQSFYYMKGKAYYHYNCKNLQSATHTFVTDKWNDYKKLYQYIEEYFGDCQEYDFREQIDKVLLFFVYNAIGEITGTNQLELREKVLLIKSILNEDIVRAMFRRIRIGFLPISWKLKVVTACYKYRLGISVLVVMLKK